MKEVKRGGGRGGNGAGLVYQEVRVGWDEIGLIGWRFRCVSAEEATNIGSHAHSGNGGLLGNLWHSGMSVAQWMSEACWMSEAHRLFAAQSDVCDIVGSFLFGRVSVVLSAACMT